MALPPVPKRTSYADIGADDLTFALYHNRIAPREAMNTEDTLMPPAVKMSRRHSAADEAALKACRTHLVSANKALDEAGAPDADGDGIPDSQEAAVKAVPGIAPDAHGGAMACFVTSPETQALLRGLLPAELRADSEADHLTIAYLTPDAASCADCKGDLLRGLVAVAESGGPIVGTLGGLARFPASETSDGMDVLVALFDAPGLDDLRVAVMDAACCAELDPPIDHGFIPHITLAYIDPAEPTPAITMARTPITFDAITLVWAGERIDIPLSGEGDDYEAEDDGEGEGDMGEQTVSAGRMLTEDDIRRGPPALKMADGGEVFGPAARFGSPAESDLSHQRDFFTKSTDFWIDRWDRRPMIYDHAMVDDTLITQLRKQGADRGAIKAMEEALDYLRWHPVIGVWTKAIIDPMALWLQGEMDKAHRYRSHVKLLIDHGLLKISTDSAPHLVIRDPQPNGTNEIKRWPFYAASLTPWAAEPRLHDVQALKGYYEAAGLPFPGNLPGTQAPTKAAPEASQGAAGGELARVLAATTSGFLVYRLRSRYTK